MHPTDEQLIAWVLGETAAETRGHLEQRCAECEARVRRIEHVLGTLRSDRDPDAPAEWITRAVGILAGVGPIPAALERVRRWGRGLAEVAALLVTDSSAAPAPAFGVRSAGGARRLRFESSDVELDVEVESAAGGVRVTGQFASLEPEPRPLAREAFLLVTSSGAWHDGRTDDLGEFDARVESAEGLQLRVIHGDRIHSFVVPEPRQSA